MSGRTNISWSDMSWNPLVGCSKVSEGCRNCYAMVMAARIANAAQARLRKGEALTDIQSAYHRVVKWEQGGNRAADQFDKALPAWNNSIELLPSVLDQPLRWTRPRRIFVNSMTDLFHESVPFEFIDRVFAVMALCPQHVFQVLTKRPERMAEYLRAPGFSAHQRSAMIDVRTEAHRMGHARPIDIPWPLPNVWLGASCEDQKAADERIPHLLKCPAAVRFLSCEPLIGPINLLAWLQSRSTFEKALWNAHVQGFVRPEEITKGLTRFDSERRPDGRPGLDWIIGGGESGARARGCDLVWLHDLVRQANAASVPMFVKQLGKVAFHSGYNHGDDTLDLDSHGADWERSDFPDDLKIREFAAVAHA